MKGIAKGTLFTTLSLTFLLAGCGNGASPASSAGPANEKANPAPSSVSQEPFTLFFYTAVNGNYANEKNFDHDIGQFIKKKFPYITVEHVHKGKGTDYADLISQGKIPDIVLDAGSRVGQYIVPNQLQYDLSELMKKNNVDEKRFDPAVMQFIRNGTPDGKLYGLPFTLSNFLMFYNKDIFDKFSVPYPKDGMTWDQTYELAKRLNRTEGGKAYRGFMANDGLMLKYNQLSLSPLDPKADKAAVDTDAWKKAVDNFRRFYELPNNNYIPVDDFPKGEIAMSVHVAEKVVAWPDANPAMNWDIVAPPSFSEKPKTGFQANPYVMFLTQQSKHKDAAFQVMQYLTSDEVQTTLAKDGVVTPLVNKAVQLAWGQNLPELKGKNAQAVFYNKTAEPAPPRASGLTFYDPNWNVLWDDILKKNLDTNTALRDMQDQSDKAIQALVSGKK